MDKLFLLKNNYNGVYFGGILPQEIEDLIFKNVWFFKMQDFNKKFKIMFDELETLNLPLTENCSLVESLDLFESTPHIPILKKLITNYQYKELTSPYKWWNTRLPLNFTYRQIYFISESTQYFNNNWYYQEEYSIVTNRFRCKFLEDKNMKIVDYTDKKNNVQFRKKYKYVDLNSEDWSNKGVNKSEYSIYPTTFKDKKIIYYYDIEEEYPLIYDNVCYFVN